MNRQTKKQQKLKFIKECYELQKHEGYMIERLEQELQELKINLEIQEGMLSLGNVGVIYCGNVGQVLTKHSQDKTLNKQMMNTQTSLTYSKRKRKFYIYAHNLDLPNAIRMNQKIIDFEYKILEMLEEGVERGETIKSTMMKSPLEGTDYTNHKGDDAYLTTCNHFKNAQECRTMCMKVLSIHC